MVELEVAAAELSTERLEAEIVGLSARLAAATCRLVLLIGELDRRQAWASWGCRSCAHWLSWQTGLALGAAREKVRVARALEHLPVVSAAFARGELSYSKVRALTRMATPGTEADLVSIARAGTAAHVERLARAHRRCTAAADEMAQRQHAQRRVTWYWDDDGSWVLSGRLTPDEGALVRQALQRALEQVPAEPAVEPAQRQADALTVLADSFLAHGPAGRTGGDRTQIVVHVEPAALGEDQPGDVSAETPGAPDQPVGEDQPGDVSAETPRCHLDDGPALTTETARRLACDATVVVVEEGADGQVRQVGEANRSIPPALRRALRVRDEQCRFPGCTHRWWVDAHHVLPRARHGPTVLENLVLLCRFHHRLVHESGYRVQLDGRDVRWWHPNGWELRPRPSPPVEGDALAFLPEVAPDAGRCQWGGERFDLADAIEVLLWRQAREHA